MHWQSHRCSDKEEAPPASAVSIEQLLLEGEMQSAIPHLLIGALILWNALGLVCRLVATAVRSHRRGISGMAHGVGPPVKPSPVVVSGDRHPVTPYARPSTESAGGPK